MFIGVEKHYSSLLQTSEVRIEEQSRCLFFFFFLNHLITVVQTQTSTFENEHAPCTQESTIKTWAIAVTPFQG